jgi:branched-chain amino acid transport system substrate-binding protein
MRASHSGKFIPAKNRIVLLLTCIVCCVIVIISGCSTKVDDNEILIGEFSSLTGTAAQFGISTHQGLGLAVDEINTSGGVLGKKIRVQTEDDQSKPEEAATAVTKLINRDKVKAVVGEVASSRSLAAAPICQSNGIPMITPSSTNPRVTQVGDYIFRVCFIDNFQGTVCANFAYNSLKVRKVAILKDVRNEYSVGLTEFFTNKFKELGGTIIAEQAFSEGDNDFKAQLTALKAANPELIFLPGYYGEAALIVKQARELKMTLPFLGGDGWDSAKLIEVGGESMNGTYYCNHYTPDDTSAVVREFVAKYKAKYNVVPDAIAALAYDAGRILFAAMERAGTTDGAKVRDQIAATKDFPGVAGVVTINSERNATKSAVIIQIQNQKLAFKESILPN